MYKSCLVLLLLSFIPVTAVAQDYLNGPESVAWDSLNNRYLVSCWANGYIVAVDTSGEQTPFRSGLPTAMGNVIRGNTIYTSAGTSVRGFDLSTTDPVLNLPIPGTTQMDGMTADSSGYLYVVASIQRKVYRIDLSDTSFDTFVGSGLPPWPQDITFDKKHNRLLLASYTDNAPILSISLPDGIVDTAVITPMGNADGICMDERGFTYVTCTGVGLEVSDGCVYRYDSLFTNPPEVFSCGYYCPAGIDYNERDSILAVPDAEGGILDLVKDPFRFDSDSDLVVDAYDNCPNYPNTGQHDSDSDGVGDVCDNCIDTPNSDQLDNDDDGSGDLCDDDDDDDSVTDSLDNCQFQENTDQLDTDADSVGNVCDNCPDTYNPYQYDEDEDGEGDACEAAGIYIQCCLDMPQPYLNEPFSYQLLAVGGTSPYTWDKISGQLPMGLSLSSDGVISGTPGYVYTYMFYLMVEDQIGTKDYAWITMDVQEPPVPPYLCGDADGSETIDIDDVVFLISFIFAGGPAPDPLEAGDVDCSAGVDIDDAVWLINYIFADGNEPCDTDGDGMPDC